MKKFFLVLIASHFAMASFAQEGDKKKITFQGYLKNMGSFNYFNDELWVEDLTHNRLNFAWYPDDDFSIYVEFRNRLFVGDFVRGIPHYNKIVDSNNDYFDLSANLVDTKYALLNVMADRAYVQWNKNNWEVKVGRQRINWGVNLAWNPNDWFNAYSFFDFDYEERPGSDAVRISKYTGATSSIEVAAKMADNLDHFVGAGMWKVNKWNYDMQFLAGLAQGDLALGTGWAGNLGKAGFKGELSYFVPVAETSVNRSYEGLFLGALSVDYSFPNTLYLNGSVMYNSVAEVSPSFGFAFSGARPGNFTVRNISNYRWSSFVQSSYQFSPLVYGGLSVIANPGSHAFFLNPGLTVSIKQNLDVDMVGQLFFDEDPLTGVYGSLARSGFIRLKWSF
ncbi:MAG TPA: hypothetical protein PKW06_03520 [Cyclobacteriaceae bacterium]|nr:hypothetical protein [Cyclobacteriaceae bacterium]